MTEQVIRQQVVLKAPREKVWEAISTPEGWNGWFGENAQGGFQLGDTMILDGISYAVVVEMEAPSRFAYKWHPGEECAVDKYPESEMTTVRFLLEDHPEGTLLTLIETGFENIPEERRARCVTLNTDGWRWELGELQAYLEQGERHLLASKEIVRERVYRTTPEKLWDLVATPEGLKKWWVKEVEGEFKVGEQAMLTFEYLGGEICGPLRVVESRRPEVFAFLSQPGAVTSTYEDFDESKATTTTFTITAVEEGAHLKVVESDFENVPEELRPSAQVGNSEGWTEVMNMIERAVG